MDGSRLHPIVSGRRWRIARYWAVSLCALTAVGCSALPPWSVAPETAFGPPPMVPNPVAVNVTDRDFVWEQVVDVVDADSSDAE